MCEKTLLFREVCSKRSFLSRNLPSHVGNVAKQRERVRFFYFLTLKRTFLAIQEALLQPENITQSRDRSRDKSRTMVLNDSTSRERSRMSLVSAIRADRGQGCQRNRRHSLRIGLTSVPTLQLSSCHPPSSADHRCYRKSELLLRTKEHCQRPV